MRTTDQIEESARTAKKVYIVASSVDAAKRVADGWGLSMKQRQYLLHSDNLRALKPRRGDVFLVSNDAESPEKNEIMMLLGCYGIDYVYANVP